jgi:hypothetical protein
MTEGGICQDRETNQPSEVHSLSGDDRGRDLSGRTRKQTNRGTLTLWRRQKEGPVRTRKEIDRVRGTHFLERAEGGACQNTETNRSSEAHSQTGHGRRRDLSGHGNKPTERGPLTNWRRQKEGPVRTRKEIDRVRGTHILETAEGGTCQDTETNRSSEGHSLSGDGRGRDFVRT